MEQIAGRERSNVSIHLALSLVATYIFFLSLKQGALCLKKEDV
jgi:hypothetical protein